MLYRTRLNPRIASTQQAGFTLVELMVALVLGLLISLAAFSTYSSQRVASSLGKQTSLLQEEGSRALDAMARDLRQAGDFNCANVPGTTVVRGALPAISGIRGFSSTGDIESSGLTGAAAVKTAITAGSGAATQVLAITGTLESMAIMTAAASSGDSNVTVNPQDFAANQTVVISDCVNASVLTVSAYTPGSATFSASLLAGYAAGTSVSRIATIWWFFGTPKFGTAWPKGLYRVDGNAADTNGTGFKLIATRVENVAFTFDRDTNATPDGVIDVRSQTPAQVSADPATAVDDWKTVRRVKVEVLLKSDTEVLPEKQAYFFGGAAVEHNADKRMYLPLELSTTLRNMY